ncbi:hypothetical protein NBT05_11385 [Aquimarina sp. ERC-38]|uniref:hypothetical protein n=1 Tax=Aquimarina sp. ERC-38 TaxID=2949996 RepID=UPI002245E5E4|nr:hypothetical protein [Aquimarina sp. ERC-38]UZO79558.1 hypothetical protein NBT05_11385 [Aquimarina sp. ERC-38]
MDIQSEKIELTKLLLSTNNPNILNSIREIFNLNKTDDFWDELGIEEKEEIKKGSKEIRNGEFISYDSFMSTHR